MYFEKKANFVCFFPVYNQLLMNMMDKTRYGEEFHDNIYLKLKKSQSLNIKNVIE